MKLSLFITFSFLFSFMAYGQEFQTNKKNFISFEYGNSASDLHVLSSNNALNADEIKELNQESTKGLGLNVRFLYIKKLSNYVNLKGGIELASQNYGGPKQEDLRWPSESDGMGGFVLNPDYIHEYKPHYNSLNALIPIGLRIQSPYKKTSPFVEYLFSPGVEFRKSSSTLSETEIGRDIVWENNFVLYHTLSAGFSYHVNADNMVFTSLYGQVQTPRNISTDLNGMFYSFGINFGARKAL